MIKYEVIKAIQETGLIAILRGVDQQDVIPLAEALYAGGVRVIEITCNSPRYLESIAELKAAAGCRMYVGAGTVTNSVMAQLVVDAGADFVLAPDFNPEVVSMVNEKHRLMIPAVMSPSEILQASRLGVDLLKVFPANSLGVSYFKEVQGPLNGLALIAVGGINLENIGQFAAAGAFAAGIGSALINKTWIANKDWKKITDQAELFISAFKSKK